MKKIIAIVGVFLGMLAMGGKAEAGFISTRSTGTLLIGSSTTKLNYYEQFDITAVRVGTVTQTVANQSTHFVLLIDSNTGTTGVSFQSYEDCYNNYPVANRIAPPLFFQSTNTVTGMIVPPLGYYEFPPGTTVKNGLVICQQGLPAAGGTAGFGGDVTIYTEIPRRRTSGDNQ